MDFAYVNYLFLFFAGIAVMSLIYIKSTIAIFRYRSRHIFYYLLFIVLSTAMVLGVIFEYHTLIETLHFGGMALIEIAILLSFQITGRVLCPQSAEK
ncbi:MAG: hypothetical protein GXO25_04415 [Euryarchaeota archaeon]|nr:hypothetical protein [Euryarchaeota archaeon]